MIKDIKICEHCGVEVERPLDAKGYKYTSTWWNKRRFCSKKCAGKNRNVRVKGFCTICGKGFEIKRTLAGKSGYGKYCSWKCQNEARKGKRVSPTTEIKKGDHLSPSTEYKIKPTTTALRYARGCSKYTGWRAEVFQRDNWTCSICGIRGGKLHAHHIKPFHKLFDELQPEKPEDVLTISAFWDVDNGETMCVSCHKTTPSYAGKDRYDK